MSSIVTVLFFTGGLGCNRFAIIDTNGTFTFKEPAPDPVLCDIGVTSASSLTSIFLLFLSLSCFACILFLISVRLVFKLSNSLFSPSDPLKLVGF